MGAKGIYLAEEATIIPIIPGSSAVAGTQTSDWFHLKEAAHASILIMTGATTSGPTVTLHEATSNAGSGSTAIVFNYAEASTAGSDIPLAVQAATVGGFGLSTRDNMWWVIELDASQLSDGSPYVAIQLTSAAATIVSAMAILTGRRYSEDIGLSAID